MEPVEGQPTVIDEQTPVIIVEQDIGLLQEPTSPNPTHGQGGTQPEKTKLPLVKKTNFHITICP